ncbi:hypothetical protein [Xanthomonas dyei]|uniref:hypothetical protein n=1 Tax=Xanthomonas dyei TaxID=743699 RepID=UPI001E636453|nr:hypothetical protein [Xanthomonas dyei]MCC4635312.1 hypothetical protein [Xanthomonas dyei pv. eucalypti]
MRKVAGADRLLAVQPDFCHAARLMPLRSRWLAMPLNGPASAMSEANAGSSGTVSQRVFVCRRTTEGQSQVHQLMS